jgi:heme exporter protein A
VPLPPPHLTADGLTQRFGRRELFRNLDLEVGAGEALALTGPNGAGKSTLLSILAGLLTPTAGEVRLRIGQRDVAAEQRPLEIGFVAPYLHLYDDFSAEENLDFIARARRLPDPYHRIEQVLMRVGLAGRGADAVKTYSSGMRQRLRFAAALLPEPSILFLDEPGSNLDATGRALVAEVVAAHCDFGGAVVLATNVEEEAGLCSRRVEIVPALALTRA